MTEADLKTFGQDRLGIIAPYGAQNMFSGLSPNDGVGQEEWEQGYISLKGEIDRLQLGKQATRGKADKLTVYPWLSDKEGDIIGGDIVFHMPEPEGSIGHDDFDCGGEQNTAQLVPVISTFAGLGDFIRASFPHDEEMQRQCIEYYCSPLGMARGGARFDNQALVGSNFAVQIGGVITKPPVLAISVGQKARYRAPLPSNVRNANGDNSRMPERPVYGIEPYTPESFSEGLQAHVRTYLMQKTRYINTLKNYHKSHALMAAMDHTFTFARMNFVIQLYAMMTAMRMDTIPLSAPYDFIADRARPSKRENFILGLARCLDLIEITGGDIANVEITEQIKENWTLLGMQMLQSSFYSGESAQLGFGWDDNTQDNAYIDQASRRIVTDLPGGELLNMQFNAHRLHWSGISQFVQKDLALTPLTCIKASKGNDENAAYLT